MTLEITKSGIPLEPSERAGWTRCTTFVVIPETEACFHDVANRTALESRADMRQRVQKTRITSDILLSDAHWLSESDVLMRQVCVIGRERRPEYENLSEARMQTTPESGLSVLFSRSISVSVSASDSLSSHCRPALPAISSPPHFIDLDTISNSLSPYSAPHLIPFMSNRFICNVQQERRK